MGGENTTGQPQERFLAFLLPVEQAWNEGQQFSVTLQVIARERSDGISSQSRIGQLTTQFLPGLPPTFRNFSPGRLRELLSQDFPPGGGRGGFQQSKESRFIGRRKPHLMDDIRIATRTFQVKEGT